MKGGGVKGATEQGVPTPADMTKTISPAPKAEQFDHNTVELEGIIQRIWEHGGSVFFRLAVFDQLRIDNDTHLYHGVTCRLPEGMVGNQLISLLPGDPVRVIGHLVDAPYIETMRQFLTDARAADFLDSIPDPAGWSAVKVSRVSTIVDAQDVIQTQIEKGKCHNRTTVQGVIAKVWERGGNVLARLAVYDAHTTIASQNGKLDRPRRTPHYVTILFLDGKVNERAVHLEVKNRLRVIGYLSTRFYRESLKEILLRSKNLSLLNNLPNSDRVGDISAAREATYVVAQSAIVFASLGSQAKNAPEIPHHAYNTTS
jgi:hypothetical protein